MQAVRINEQRTGALYSRFFWIVVALLCGAATARAQPGGPIISEIRIQGNQRVEADAIKIHISSRAGQPLDQATVDADIKNIYKMGFFDHASADIEHQGGAVVLTYIVQERPLITDVRFGGMKAIKSNDDKVINAVKLHGGSVLDPTRVEATIQGLKQIYEEKGYLDAKVTFRTVPAANNTAIGVFDVVEGPLVHIAEVDFQGNTAISTRELRNTIATHQHNLLSFFFDTGVLDQKKLQDDVDRITGVYYNKGYLNVHVSEPVVTRVGNSLKVTFTIDEGPVFHVGTVDVAGDLKVPKKDLLEKLTVKPKEVFAGAEMQHDVLTLSDFYSDRGYAYVNVDPRTQIDPATRTVNVVYGINPGREVLVDRINITGNTKTSDKVIRRELLIQEQEPYSTSKIQNSKRRLDARGYFSNTPLKTSRTPCVAVSTVKPSAGPNSSGNSRA